MSNNDIERKNFIEEVTPETVPATYVSSWDNGNTVIRSKCQYNPKTKKVSDIESVDIDGLDFLDEEYVELVNGTIIKTFINEDDNEIVDGQLQD